MVFIKTAESINRTRIPDFILDDMLKQMELKFYRSYKFNALEHTLQKNEKRVKLMRINGWKILETIYKNKHCIGQHV